MREKFQALRWQVAPQRPVWRTFVQLSLLGLLIWLVIPSRAQAATPVDAGYKSFQFGASCNSTPTGEKPESKLWFNDGFWWGSLCTAAGTEYRIFRFNVATNDWIDSGTMLDDREGSKADVLWDSTAQKLYVASHAFSTTGAASTSQNDWGRLYRYSYNTGTKTYSLDAGFPVHVTRGKSETLTIAKDSTGKLWVTYAESGKVMVNHSNGNDATWGTPYALPVTGASGLSSDDIASLISYGGRIGIMWSNQSTKIMYFASHLDSEANDQTWQSVSTYNPGGSGADDHINLKELQSAGGKVFAVTKTSFSTGNLPLILLMACSTLPCTSPNQWTAHTIYTTAENDTRPILLIDTSNQKLHVFTTDNGSGGIIRHKTSDINNIAFAPGEGEIFIRDAADSKTNNATSTKQNLNSSTGLLVLISSQTSRFYYHNYLSLGGGGPVNNPPTANAGADQSISLPTNSVNLAGSVSDDGLPNPPATVSAAWSKVSGPGTVTFGNANAASTTATFSAAGTYILRLTANDSVLSTSDDVTITVNSGPPVNQAPVVNAGVDQTIAPGATANLAGTVSDDGLPSNNVTKTWSRVSGPGTVSFGNANAEVTTATFSTVGTYVLRLEASDGALTSSDEVTIMVSSTTSATFTPVADAQVNSASATANYGTLATIRLRGVNSPTYNTYLRFNVTGVSGTVQSAKVRLFVTDASAVGGSIYTLTDNGWSESGINWNNAPGITGSPLHTLGAVALNTWVEFNVTTAVTGNGTFVFGLNTPSTDSVIFSSKEGTNPPQLILTVNSGPPVNQPPTVNAGADQGIILPNNSVTLAGTVANPDGLPAGGSVTASWSVFSGPAGVNFGDANAATTTATFATAGVYVLRLTGNDGELSAFDEVTITVNSAPVNQPPVVNAGADQSIALPTNSVNLDGTVTNADNLPVGGVVTGAWSLVSGPTSVNFGDANAIDTTATFPMIGVYVLRLTGSDGELSAFDDVTITVNDVPTNQPPTVNAGADQAITLPVNSVNLDGTVTNLDNLPAGGAITGAWSVVSGPAGVTFGNANAIDTSATFATAGVYMLRLTGSDGALAATDDVQITVSAQAATVTFTPISDAQVKSDSATTNYGTLATLRLRGNSTTMYRTYLKFNVSGLSGPIQSAKVRLFAVTQNSNDGGGIYLVNNNYLNTTTPWSETALIWNNAPTISGSPLSSVGAVTANSWVEYDVTAAITGDGVYSFGIMNNSTTSAYFASKESTNPVNPPQLVITQAGGAANVQANRVIPTGPQESGTIDTAGIIYATEDLTPDDEESVTPTEPNEQAQGRFMLYLPVVEK